MISADPPAFIFSIGACQAPETFALTEEALAARGYRSFTPDTRFNVPGTTFQAAGQILAAAIEDFARPTDSSLTIVGHSNGANAAFWAASELEQQANPNLFKTVRILLVNGGLDPSLVSLSLGRPLAGETPPAKNTQRSREAVIAAPGFKRNQYMTIFDKRIAAGLLYGNVDPKIAERLVRTLRPHYRPPARLQPKLKKFPTSPIDSIVTIGDPVVKHQFQTYRDRLWFGIKSDLLIGADHSPHLSIPHEFVDKMIEIAWRRPQPKLATQAAAWKNAGDDGYWETFDKR